MNRVAALVLFGPWLALSWLQRRIAAGEPRPVPRGRRGPMMGPEAEAKALVANAAELGFSTDVTVAEVDCECECEWQGQSAVQIVLRPQTPRARAVCVGQGAGVLAALVAIEDEDDEAAVVRGFIEGISGALLIARGGSLAGRV